MSSHLNKKSKKEVPVEFEGQDQQDTESGSNDPIKLLESIESNKELKDQVDKIQYLKDENDFKTMKIDKDIFKETKTLYEERRELLKEIPDFWSSIFSAFFEDPTTQHVLDFFVEDTDKECKLYFSFKENEIIKNKEITITMKSPTSVEEMQSETLPIETTPIELIQKLSSIESDYPFLDFLMFPDRNKLVEEVGSNPVTLNDEPCFRNQTLYLCSHIKNIARGNTFNAGLISNTLPYNFTDVTCGNNPTYEEATLISKFDPPSWNLYFLVNTFIDPPPFSYSVNLSSPCYDFDPKLKNSGTIYFTTTVYAKYSNSPCSSDFNVTVKDSADNILINTKIPSNYTQSRLSISSSSIDTYPLDGKVTVGNNLYTIFRGSNPDNTILSYQPYNTQIEYPATLYKTVYHVEGNLTTGTYIGIYPAPNSLPTGIVNIVMNILSLDIKYERYNPPISSFSLVIPNINIQNLNTLPIKIYNLFNQEIAFHKIGSQSLNLVLDSNFEYQASFPFGFQKGKLNDYTFVACLSYSGYKIPSVLKIQDQVTVDLTAEFPKLDNKPPVLRNVELITKSSQYILVRIEAQDDLSGVDFIKFKSANNFKIDYRNRISGTNLLGIYEATIPYQQLTDLSTNNILLCDSAGNTAEFNSDGTVLPFNTNLIQIPLFTTIAGFTITDISNFSWSYNNVDTSMSPQSTILTFKVSKNNPNFTPILYLNLNQLQESPSIFTGKWNANDQTYSIPVWIPQNQMTRRITYSLLLDKLYHDPHFDYLFGQQSQLYVTSKNGDNLPPLVTDLTSELNGELISWYLTIKDSINGFKSGKITISSDKNPQKETLQFGEPNLVVGDLYNGIYRIDQKVSHPVCVNQVFTIQSASLVDKFGNTGETGSKIDPFLMVSDKSKLKIQYTCSNPSTDNIEPSLVDFRVTMSENERGRSAELTISISDSGGSGIFEKNNPIFYISTRNLDISECTSSIVYYSKNLANYSCIFSIPDNFIEYSTLSAYGFYDNSFNLFGVSTSHLSNSGFQYFLVTSQTKLAPYIESHSKVVVGGGSVDIYGNRFGILSDFIATVRFKNGTTADVVPKFFSNNFFTFDSPPLSGPTDRLTIQVKSENRPSLVYILYRGDNVTPKPTESPSPINCGPEPLCSGNGICGIDGCKCTPSSNWTGPYCNETIIPPNKPSQNRTEPTVVNGDVQIRAFI
eukprot:gene9628-11800_t